MRFTTAALATLAATATASVLPRADYGAWNVSISSTGGSDRQRTETVTGVYANAELKDNIPVNCHLQGMLNGEVINQLTCDPESFSYDLELTDYDDGYLYQLTLTQTVTLSGTNVTVKGRSDKFERPCDGVTGKSCAASNILVTATKAVA